MTEASTTAPRSIRQALFDCEPGPGAYDELRGAGPAPLRRWAPLLEQPLEPNPADAADTGQAWPFDPFPYVMDAGEWRTIERGLVQRSRLLNALAADFYGDRKLLLRHGLPPALLFANPGYLPQCDGVRAGEAIALDLIAFDLGRSPDGQWRVLANRTDAPAGLGIAVENRIRTARLLAGAADALGIAPVDGFLDGFASRLKDGDVSHPGSVAVILSEAGNRADHTDHALLGRSLGIPVADASGLAASTAGMHLKTPPGTRPVRTILRGIDSLSSDPLELPTTSLHGIPGLLGCAYRGQVRLSNAIGAGVLESPALAAFLPGLCRQLFDETLVLPDLATWWCGQPREAAQVTARLDTLVVSSAFEQEPFVNGSLLAGQPRQPQATEPETTRRRIEQRPWDYVGREPMLLSAMPCWQAHQRLRPAPFTLRLFVAATGNGYRLMPGGLARAATSGGPLFKDVWVPCKSARDGGRGPSCG